MTAFFLIAAFAVLLLLPFAIVGYASRRAFGSRYENYCEGYLYKPGEYPELNLTEWDVPGNMGQNIHICVYSHKYTTEEKGLIFWSSGIGGDHSAYLPILSELAEKGYFVAAYDPTGTGKSGGNCVRGLPQNLIDGKTALKSVRRIEALHDMPLYLMGHSNGAYAALALLGECTDVCASAVFAPFNKTTDMVLAHCHSFSHGFSRLISPYIRLYYRVLFGKEAEISAADSMRNANIPILLVHGREDDVVPFAESEHLMGSAVNIRSQLLSLRHRKHAAMYLPEVWEQLEPLKLKIRAGNHSDEIRQESIRYYEIAKNVDRELLEQIDRFFSSSTRQQT